MASLGLKDLILRHPPKEEKRTKIEVSTFRNGVNMKAAGGKIEHSQSLLKGSESAWKETIPIINEGD